MISIRDLEQLMKREPKPGSPTPTLSVYLSTDPSRPANTRRSFEAVLYQMLRSIEGQLKEKPLRKRFAEDAERVQQVVETHLK